MDALTHSDLSVASPPAGHRNEDASDALRNDDIGENMKSAEDTFADPPRQAESVEDEQTFTLELDQFSGPFDLLLSLISSKKLDITLLALSEVTDEFISHMKAYPDLSQTSEFLVVAATLLDMKAARLLPVDETDEEDLELLEARDVLFARLLQYRAFKEVSLFIRQRLQDNDGYYARNVDDPLSKMFTPELVRHISLEAFALTAFYAFEPLQRDQTLHLHDVTYPVGPEAETIMSILKESPKITFSQLIVDLDDLHRRVSRFLALLVLYRDGYIDVYQESALAPLMIELEHELERDAHLNLEWDY